jgi:hypothetical protein
MINPLEYYRHEGKQYAAQQDATTRTFLYEQFRRSLRLEAPEDRKVAQEAWDEGRSFLWNTL